MKSLDQIRSQKLLVWDCLKDLRFDKGLKTLRKELT